MKKFALAFLLLLFASVANAQLYYKSATFDLIGATKSTVYPGVQGSPIVTTLQFQMVLKKCTRLTLDSFWMDGITDKINVDYANGSAWDGKPLKGDTLRITLVYYRSTKEPNEPDRGYDAQKSSAAEPPVKHKGAVLFRYSLGKEKYYFSIKNVKKGSDVYAP